MVPCRTRTGAATLNELDTLFTLAEIAIGMAGFSAIVVLFKRRDSGAWAADDADRFNGMVLHSIAAAFFCILPSVLDVFTGDPAWTWTLGSALLGAQVLAHVVIVLRLPSSSLAVRISVGSMGLLVVVLQLANAAGLGFAREFGPYLVGVLWHMFQAGLLFVSLIWVRAADVEGDERSAAKEER